jgi:DNA polymerase I-like protein with 3'-5' exonuclease and polymerase domains
MIQFITKRNDHEVSGFDFDVTDCHKQAIEYLIEQDSLGIDSEFNSLFFLHADLLLFQVGDRKNQYVFDATSISPSVLEPLKDKLFIAHNMKIDYTMLKHHGFDFRKHWCTLITEQTLGLGSGRPNNLEATVERRLNKKLDMSKDIRNEFIQMNKYSKFKDRHILYAVSDIVDLHDIVEVQKEVIKRYQLEHLMYNIKFPLIPVLANTAETEGLVLDTEKWLDILKDNKQKQVKIEQRLDEEVARLAQGNEHMTGGKYTRRGKRQNVEIVQTSMFGDVADNVKTYKTTARINYKSTDEVKKIFNLNKARIPIKKDKKTGEFKETVGREELEEYQITYPDNNLYDFIEGLIDYANVSTKISSFGRNFIDKIQAKTGKIHTFYKQVETDTGRLASGSKDLPVFNSQNVPKEKKYRVCFGTDPGYDILTIDLTAAELVILGALSGDKKLLRLIEGDPHSPLASAGYTAILKAMFKNQKTFTNAEIQTVQKLLSDEKKGKICSREDAEEAIREFTETGKLTIHKERFGWIRDKFKNVLYGFVYGASAVRVAKVLNVDKLYAELVLFAIAKELPVSVEYLERMAKFGVDNFYVPFNTRTNSRRWFQNALDAALNRRPLPKGAIGDIERACKNAPIQGTQSDMLCEAMVRIDAWIRETGIDANLLLTVHDELVYRFPEGEHLYPYKGKMMVFPEIVKEILTSTCNLYLNGVTTMKADYHVGKTWTK